MAKVQAVVKSGSVGPSTFQRSRQGLIERQRVQPVDPQTEAQLAQRGIVKAVSGQWRHLSDEQRAGWTALANKLSGQLIGINAYMQVNVPRAKCGLPTLPEAPAMPAFGRLTCAGLWVTDSPQVQLRQVSASAGADRLLIDASRPLSAGITQVGNRLCRLTMMAAPVGAPADLELTEVYFAKFGRLAAGERLFVRLTLLKDGFQGDPLQVSALVQAGGAETLEQKQTKRTKAPAAGGS